VGGGEEAVACLLAYYLPSLVKMEGERVRKPGVSCSAIATRMLVKLKMPCVSL
jgi:hypothetical protein